MSRRPLILVALLMLAGCDSAVHFRLPPLAQSDKATALEVVNVEAAPVLTTGAPGEFDSVDVLNPSVLLRPDGKYWNLYSGFDGKTWHTGLAVSENGRSPWTKLGRVLSPEGSEGDYIAANGTALNRRAEVLYWYQAGRVRPHIGLARSTDGKTWKKDAQGGLQAGPYRSWDEFGVADPYVVQLGEFYYLYYTGLDRAQRQQLGMARSRDGVHWEKNAANPILELGSDALDEGGLGEPAFFVTRGSYWMLYTGRAWDEQRRIGLARSDDGVTWTRVPGWVFAGREAWDRKVVCDPTVEVQPDGTIRMWFGGGDVASPDERLNGRIGMGTLLAR